MNKIKKSDYNNSNPRISDIANKRSPLFAKTKDKDEILILPLSFRKPLLTFCRWWFSCFLMSPSEYLLFFIFIVMKKLK